MSTSFLAQPLFQIEFFGVQEKGRSFYDLKKSKMYFYGARLLGFVCELRGADTEKPVVLNNTGRVGGGGGFNAIARQI